MVGVKGFALFLHFQSEFACGSRCSRCQRVQVAHRSDLSIRWRSS
jgi:hypothetical protein